MLETGFERGELLAVFTENLKSNSWLLRSPIGLQFAASSSVRSENQSVDRYRPYPMSTIGRVATYRDAGQHVLLCGQVENTRLANAGDRICLRIENTGLYCRKSTEIP